MRTKSIRVIFFLIFNTLIFMNSFSTNADTTQEFHRAIDEIKSSFDSRAYRQVLLQVKPLLDRIHQQRTALIKDALPSYDEGWELIDYVWHIRRYNNPYYEFEDEYRKSVSDFQIELLYRKIYDFVHLHIQEYTMPDETMLHLKTVLEKGKSDKESEDIIAIQDRKALMKINSAIHEGQLLMFLKGGTALLTVTHRAAYPVEVIKNYVEKLDLPRLEKALKGSEEEEDPNQESPDMFQQIKNDYDRGELGNVSFLLEKCADRGVSNIDIHNGRPLPFKSGDWQMTNTIFSDLFSKDRLWSLSLSYHKGADEPMVDGAFFSEDVRIQIIDAPDSKENQILESKFTASKDLNENEKVIKVGDYSVLVHSSGIIKLLLCDGAIRFVMYGKYHEVNDLVDSLLKKFDLKTLESNLCKWILRGDGQIFTPALSCGPAWMSWPLNRTYIKLPNGGMVVLVDRFLTEDRTDPLDRILKGNTQRGPDHFTIHKARLHRAGLIMYKKNVGYLFEK